MIGADRRVDRVDRARAVASKCESGTARPFPSASTSASSSRATISAASAGNTASSARTNGARSATNTAPGFSTPSV